MFLREGLLGLMTTHRSSAYALEGVASVTAGELLTAIAIAVQVRGQAGAGRGVGTYNFISPLTRHGGRLGHNHTLCTVVGFPLFGSSNRTPRPAQPQGA